MEVKKKFKLIDDEKEEEFLNEMSLKGYILDKIENQVYYFSKTKDKVYYMIEFFYKELTTYEIRTYSKRGYELVYTFKSKDAGYYYYFVSNTSISEENRNYLDRYDKLFSSKQRIDRFSMIIFLSSFTLFSYLYFKTRNNLYIIVLLFIILLVIYYANTYIETIKRLSYYVKHLEGKESTDGDNEGRSEES